MAWLSNKIRETRLGFAIGLKFFQQEHCFPAAANDVPPEVISHIAQQVKVDATEFENYDWGSRAARYHRQQIRELCGFRRSTAFDIKFLCQWLEEAVIPRMLDEKQLQEAANQQFRQLGIELLTVKQLRKTIQIALSNYEAQLYQRTFSQLLSSVQAALDVLLKSPDKSASPDNAAPKDDISRFGFLKQEPSALGVKTLLQEVKKLQILRQVGLPDDLFQSLRAKHLQVYRTRAATESIWELCLHPVPIRYTLVAAFCRFQQKAVTDQLINLLNGIIQKLNRRAEQRCRVKR